MTEDEQVAAVSTMYEQGVAIDDLMFIFGVTRTELGRLLQVGGASKMKPTHPPSEWSRIARLLTERENSVIDLTSRVRKT